MPQDAAGSGFFFVREKGVRNLFCEAPWPVSPTRAVSPAATGKRFLTPFLFVTDIAAATDQRLPPPR